MKSYIYQITKKDTVRPLEASAISGILSPFGGNFADLIDIDANEREELITHLVNEILPKGMFSRCDADTIRYDGGIEQWAKEAMATVKERAGELDDFFSNNELCVAIDNPLRSPHLFFLDPDGKEGMAYSSFVLMHNINLLKPGTILHIGGIVEFYIL